MEDEPLPKRDKDKGQGDPDHFPIEDLERLYGLGGLDIAQRIQGSSLNKILGVTRYKRDQMYVVTKDGVEEA